MESQILSRSVEPEHYDLRIEPYTDTATFSGSVTIEVKVHELTTVIILNAHKLAIRSTALYDNQGDPIEVSDAGGVSTLQTFSIILEQALPPGSRLFVHQTFSGFIDKSGVGLHATEVHGSQMLSTFFEPMHARTVFPCFDEPCFKATFAVTLAVPHHLTYLSNMPIKSQSDSLIAHRDKKTVVFHHTPQIPTYLLAFAVGEFNFLECHDFRIPIRAYAPLNYDIEHCKYALEIASRVLAIYEETFKLDCGLEKLDILAVPGMVGAMENCGLVTVSSAVLFVGPDSSAAEKLSCAQLIAHEIGHQWFGNLVTMSSWENFWLKEALADWAEIMVQERLSDYLPWQDFVLEKIQKALSFDSSRFSHALAGRGTHLDAITYGKGVSVMRMLAGFVGKDAFLQGIRRFLQQNAYGNGDPEDLWEVLSQISGTDIAAAMQIWTDVPGHPVVSIEEDDTEGTITLVQSRFCGRETESTTLYPVNLEILTDKGILRECLDEYTKAIKIPGTFYKLNAGQMGFYRVAYPVSRLEKLGEEVRKGTLPVEDRIGLVCDIAALAFAGNTDLRTSHLLNFLQNFEDEASFLVWKAIIATLREVSKRLLFEDHVIRTAFMEFQRSLIQRCLCRKGNLNENDDIDESRFKALMFGDSGGDEKVVAAAESTFENFVTGDGKMLDPNVRAEVFEIVLRRGGKKEARILDPQMEQHFG